MGEYQWTASGLWDLVKDLPAEARPERLSYNAEAITCCDSPWYRTRLGEFDDDPQDCFYDGVEPDQAAALHVASVLEWLARDEDFLPAIVVCPDGSAEVSDECSVPSRVWCGPALLHALCAAAKEVARG